MRLWLFLIAPPPSVIAYYEDEQGEQQANYLRSVAFYADLDERGELPAGTDPDALAEEERNPPDSRTALLERLMTDPRMEWVWRRINTLAQRKQSETENIAQLFALIAVIGYFGPIGKVERMNPSHRARYFDDVRGAALRLAELIEDTRLDEYLWQDFKAAQFKAYFRSALTEGLQGKDLEYNDCIDLFKPRGLSEILRGLADEAEPLALDERPADA